MEAKPTTRPQQPQLPPQHSIFDLHKLQSNTAQHHIPTARAGCLDVSRNQVQVTAGNSPHRSTASAPGSVDPLGTDEKVQPCDSSDNGTPPVHTIRTQHTAAHSSTTPSVHTIFTAAARTNRTPSAHTIQTVLLPANQQSDPGILGKPPGRPLAHLDNPKVAENQNPRVVTCLPGNQVNLNHKSKRLYGKQADPSLATATTKDSSKAFTWTCRLCNYKIESTTARGISVPKHRHFKNKHPGHKKTPEDKFHAQELQQPDLGEPTDTKAAGPNHPTKLTLEAISIHNKSKNHTSHTAEPPTFGCPKKRKRDHSKAADKGWFNWWCPYCESDIPVKGDSKGLFWRKKAFEDHSQQNAQRLPIPGQYSPDQ